jgi:hypothetical protein
VFDDDDGYDDDVDVDHRTGKDCSQGLLTGDDYDHDGCKDAEDDDVDGDGILENGDDQCHYSYPATSPSYLCEGAGSSSYTCVEDDYDEDGCIGGGEWVQNGNTWSCDQAGCSDTNSDGSVDGLDAAADTWCYCEDDDDDNDGANDGVDNIDTDEFACSDDDGDTCDDCSSGSYDLSNDGVDADGDGLCDEIGSWDSGLIDSQPNCATNDEDICGVCGGDNISVDSNGNSINCGGEPGIFAYNQSSSQSFVVRFSPYMSLMEPT